MGKRSNPHRWRARPKKRRTHRARTYSTIGPRGHRVTLDGSVWRYADDGSFVWPDHKLRVRPCIRCGAQPTDDLHDACLGEVPGLRAACCGHGVGVGYASTHDHRTFFGEWSSVEDWLREEGLRPIESLLRGPRSSYPDQADEVVSGLRGSDSFGRQELMKAIRWGFARNVATIDRVEAMLSRYGDQELRDISGLAFAEREPLDRMQALTGIRSVGWSTAAVITTAQDANVPLFSRYALRGLKKLKLTNVIPVRWTKPKRSYTKLCASHFLAACASLMRLSSIEGRDLDRGIYVLGGGPVQGGLP